MDVVLTEGHKLGPYPKIEVVRANRRQRVAVFRGWLLAVVTDLDLPIGARRFQLGDASGIAAFLVAWLPLRAPSLSGAT